MIQRYVESLCEFVPFSRFSGLGSAPADPPQVRVTGLNQYQTQTKNRRLAQHMSNRPGVNQAVATTPAAKKVGFFKQGTIICLSEAQLLIL